MTEARIDRGADVVVAELLRLGGQRLYTLSGNHIMAIFDACVGRDLPLLHTRHEAACVHMADAHGRLLGSPGVALVTGGPGHANAVSALYTARMADSPMLLLSGQSPVNQAGKGAFQEIDQVAMAEPVTKAAWSVRNAEHLAADLAFAWELAAAGRPGPVSLSLPSDLLEAPAPAQVAQRSNAAQRLEHLLHSESDESVEASLSAALSWLSVGARPLVLMGPMMLAAPNRPRVRALERTMGIPCIAMDSPRGADDPRLGAFASVLARADRVLLVGKRVDFTLRFGSTPAFADDVRFMQIEPDLAELERGRQNLGPRLIHQARHNPAQCLLVLERLAGAPVAGSSAAAGRTNAPAASAGASATVWLAEVNGALERRPSAWARLTDGQTGPLHPSQVGRAVANALSRHPNAILISDGGEIGQWVQACVDSPRRVINAAAGAIGVALPMALAARAVDPSAPVVALMGDGAFGFHAMEFDTAVRHRLPFVCIIGNDQRWNAEYQIQMRLFGADRVHGCELADTGYEQIATALGASGQRISREAELQHAVTAALSSPLPVCLNVGIQGLAAPNLNNG